MKRAAVTASHVLDVLHAKQFHGTAYAFLREVRNQTGYGGQDRRADALVVSCWPSRGLWFGGVEVKVSRSDWQRELADPSKSQEIQRFCTYWWVATAPGVVKPGEMPETWGHIEVTGQSCAVLKEAPKLTPEAPSMTFIASVLRHLAQNQTEALSRARYRAREEALAEAKNVDAEQLKNDLESAIAQRDDARAGLDRLSKQVQEFQVATGLYVSDYHRTESLRLLGAARALAGIDMARMADALEHALVSLRKSAGAFEAARASKAAAE